MESIDVHSRSFAVKWVHVPDGVTVMFQIKPIKRSITFGVYRSSQDATQERSPYSGIDGADSNSSSSTSLHRRRSNTALSMEERLKNSSLVKVQSYGMLNGNDMFQSEFKAEKGGIYAFVFDNTFSKSYSKKILFNKFFVEEVTAPSTASSKPNTTRKLSVSVSSVNISNELHPNNGQYLQGYLLKKKRKKLQGFTKRYFVLNFKYNTLSYYLNEKTLKFRGEMQINLSSISAFKDENTIVIDSGMEVWILKTQNKEDWDNWTNALNFIKLSAQKTSSSQPQSASLTAGTRSPPIESKDSSPYQKSVTLFPGNPGTPRIVEVAPQQEMDQLDMKKVLETIDSKVDLLTGLLNKTSSAELASISTHLSDLSDYVKSHTSSFSRDLVLSRETSVFSEDYFDALDDLDFSNEETDYSLDNRVLLLPGKRGSSDEYSVDDLSDQDDISFELSPAEAVPAPTKDLYPLPLEPVKRRNTVKSSTTTPPSLFSFLRKNVGKDLSTISMPVTSNEPLTILQKMAEMFEHSHLLTDASLEENNDIKMLKVATFAIANLGSFRSKERNLRKPFNPILGETYELVDEKLGLRLICEKIQHKPQIFAFHCESIDWELAFSLCPEQKFWGKSLELINTGAVTLTFKSTGEVLKWQHPTTFLKNIISGERYTEPVNTVTVTSSSGLKSLVQFKKPQSGLFSSARSEELTINVIDKSGKNSNVFAEGKWTDEIIMKNIKDAGYHEKLYTASQLLKDEASKWGFTVYASNLNDISIIEQDHIPITDSRLRPDVRAFENGDVNTAETLKLDIEQKQRDRRKVVADANEVHVPSFFKKTDGDSLSYEVIKGENSYWEKRKRGDWSGLVPLW